MDGLGDILAKRQMNIPPEVRIIQDFVQKKYNTTPEVIVQGGQIVINVKGAALAGALRPYLHQLQQLCGTDKRLLIRIQ
jgi:hypothetical protein